MPFSARDGRLMKIHNGMDVKDTPVLRGIRGRPSAKDSANFAALTNATALRARRRTMVNASRKERRLTMNENNIHNQNADLYDLLNAATEAKALAEDFRNGTMREEIRAQKEEDYRTLLEEIVTISDRIRGYVFSAKWDYKI